MLHAIGGVDFILTSGGAATALEGAVTIRRMVELAAALEGDGSKAEASSGNGSAAAPAGAATQRAAITVIAGGGVTPATAGPIVAATGVTQLHGTGASSTALHP